MCVCESSCVQHGGLCAFCLLPLRLAHAHHRTANPPSDIPDRSALAHDRGKFHVCAQAAHQYRLPSSCCSFLLISSLVLLREHLPFVEGLKSTWVQPNPSSLWKLTTSFFSHSSLRLLLVRSPLSIIIRVSEVHHPAWGSMLMGSSRAYCET